MSVKRPSSSRAAASRTRRRWGAVAIMGVVAGGALVLGVNVWIRVRSAPYRHRSVAEVPSQYTAIVLGASVFRSGRPSDVLRDRLDTALELYRAGKVRKILLTGDHVRRGYDEVSAMRRHVLARGAAPADIFTDHAGLNTYDSMVRARKVFEVDRAIVVTQDFHLARAVYIARGVGIDAVGVTADRRRYRGLLYHHAREILARVKSFGEVLLRVQPRHLGPVISIRGDGRASWDRGRRARRGAPTSQPGADGRT